eukprot:3870709-Prymnesium_polylepis.1
MPFELQSEFAPAFRRQIVAAVVLKRAVLAVILVEGVVSRVEARSFEVLYRAQEVPATLELGHVALVAVCEHT